MERFSYDARPCRKTSSKGKTKGEFFTFFLSYAFFWWDFFWGGGGGGLWEYLSVPARVLILCILI